MPSCYEQLKQKHKQKYKNTKKYCNLPHKQKHTNLQTSHHQPSCLPATSNLNKNININKNTKNIAIFLTNKNTPTFEVITISHHALLLTDFWGPSTLQLPFRLPKWIGNRLLDLSSSLPPPWGPGTQLSPWARPAQDPLQNNKPRCLPECCNCETPQGLVERQGFSQSLQLREWQEQLTPRKHIARFDVVRQLPELVFPSCFPTDRNLKSKTMQNIIYIMRSKNPWNRRHLGKNDLFSTRRTVGNQLYGTLTGYNPLLCFTFTSSGVRGVSSIETIEFEAMRHAQKA